MNHGSMERCKIIHSTNYMFWSFFLWKFCSTYFTILLFCTTKYFLSIVHILKFLPKYSPASSLKSISRWKIDHNKSQQAKSLRSKFRRFFSCKKLTHRFSSRKKFGKRDTYEQLKVASGPCSTDDDAADYERVTHQNLAHRNLFILTGLSHIIQPPLPTQFEGQKADNILG